MCSLGIFEELNACIYFYQGYYYAMCEDDEEPKPLKLRIPKRPSDDELVKYLNKLSKKQKLKIKCSDKEYSIEHHKESKPTMEKEEVTKPKIEEDRVKCTPYDVMREMLKSDKSHVKFSVTGPKYAIRNGKQVMIQKESLSLDVWDVDILKSEADLNSEMEIVKFKFEVQMNRNNIEDQVAIVKFKTEEEIKRMDAEVRMLEVNSHARIEELKSQNTKDIKVLKSNNRVAVKESEAKLQEFFKRLDNNLSLTQESNQNSLSKMKIENSSAQDRMNADIKAQGDKMKDNLANETLKSEERKLEFKVNSEAKVKMDAEIIKANHEVAMNRAKIAHEEAMKEKDLKDSRQRDELRTKTDSGKEIRDREADKQKTDADNNTKIETTKLNANASIVEKRI